MKHKLVRAIFGVLLVLSLGLVIFPTLGWIYLVVLLVGGSLGHVLLGLGTPSKYIGRLDDLLYEGERAIVSASLIVMSAVVFIDVVWRTARSVAGTTTGWVFLGVIFVLCVLGGLTARLEGASVAKRIGLGLAAFVVLVVLGTLIYIAPNGFGWSQRLALVLILWVGLLGGSMAAKEGRHITVDAVRRVVPDKLQRLFEISSGLITVGLAFVLTILGIEYVRANWVDWVDSQYAASVFESLPIPYWASTLPIPVGFGLMAVRFVAVILRGERKVDLLTSMGGAREETGS